MFKLEHFIKSVELETDICKHLFNKVNLDALDYQPTENQRTTAELLRYLATCVQTPARALISNDWSQLNGELEKSNELDVKDFDAAMDRQLAAVKKLVGNLSDDDLARETTLPTGQPIILGPSLVNFPLKFITAYRMQLFLYLKGTERPELNTFNCWFGIDPQSDS